MSHLRQSVRSVFKPQSYQEKAADQLRNVLPKDVLASMSQFSNSTKKMVDTVNPWESARKLRNRIYLGILTGVFVYGFATAVPKGIAHYALERSKREKEEGKYWKKWINF